MRNVLSLSLLFAVSTGCAVYSGPFNLTAMLSDSSIYHVQSQGAALVQLVDGNAAAMAEADLILAMLNTQVAAWNRGDIDGFMEHYWKDENLIFVADGKLLNGWDAARQRYRKRYPSPAEMGQLDFDDMRILVCEPVEAEQDHRDVAYVGGRWRVKAEQKTSQGLFALVLEKMESQWTIVLDQTTSKKQS